ncbi:hypothetical protein ABTX81_19435 [Kitasatospora sp. NPDC097605]|uniref:hypothetical protein n=1 Tax=Kitasatospora sp. NPDC097605 TaxID=3157226 RepID=UPI00332621F3
MNKPGSNRPTATELLTTLGIFAAAGLVAHLAAALADPRSSRLVWWLFFAASLMTGFSRTTTGK